MTSGKAKGERRDNKIYQMKILEKGGENTFVLTGAHTE